MSGTMEISNYIKSQSNLLSSRLLYYMHSWKAEHQYKEEMSGKETYVLYIHLTQSLMLPISLHGEELPTEINLHILKNKPSPTVIC